LFIGVIDSVGAGLTHVLPFHVAVEEQSGFTFIENEEDVAVPPAPVATRTQVVVPYIVLSLGTLKVFPATGVKLWELIDADAFPVQLGVTVVAFVDVQFRE
jgi:hypothetical protein